MAGLIIFLVISFLVSLIFIILGVCQLHSKAPVGINTGEKPPKEEAYKAQLACFLIKCHAGASNVGIASTSSCNGDQFIGSKSSSELSLENESSSLFGEDFFFSLASSEVAGSSP